MLYMEQIRGYPYMRKKQLMEEFHVSRSFVDKKVQGIEKEINAGRYNRYAILDGMINVYVFMDYMKYERPLNDKNARKHVQKFGPDELMELCGFKQKVVEFNETNEVVGRMDKP